MKKFVLSLGSVAAVVAPVASVISCGDDDKTQTMNLETHKVAGSVVMGAFASGTATLEDITAVTQAENGSISWTVKVKTAGDIKVSSAQTAKTVKVGDVISFKMQVDMNTGHVANNDAIEVKIGDSTTTVHSDSLANAVVTAIGQVMHPSSGGSGSTGGSGTSTGGTGTGTGTTSTIRDWTGTLLTTGKITFAKSDLVTSKKSAALTSIKSLLTFANGATLEDEISKVYAGGSAHLEGFALKVKTAGKITFANGSGPSSTGVVTAGQYIFIVGDTTQTGGVSYILENALDGTNDYVEIYSVSGTTASQIVSVYNL